MKNRKHLLQCDMLTLNSLVTEYRSNKELIGIANKGYCPKWLNLSKTLNECKRLKQAIKAQADMIKHVYY